MNKNFLSNSIFYFCCLLCFFCLSYRYSHAIMIEKGSLQLLMHMDEFIDSSPNNHTINVFGGMVLNDSQSIFENGKSAYFDGVNDYLTIPYNEGLVLGSEDFTIDFWFYIFNNLGFAMISSGNVICNQVTNQLDWAVRVRGGSSIEGACLNLSYMKPNFHSHDIYLDIPISSWHHAAFVRKDDTILFFLDGIKIGTSELEQNFEFPNNNFPIYIGYYLGSSSCAVKFYNKNFIDEIRISKGVAYWTEDFNLPTSPYDFTDTLISIPDLQTKYQSSVSIPLQLTNTKNEPIEGIDIEIKYDAIALEAKGLSLTDTIFENKFSFNVGLHTPGKILASLSANNEPFVNSSGNIAYLNFEVLSNTSSALTIVDVVINEHSSEYKSGSVIFNDAPALPPDSPVNNKSYETTINNPFNLIFDVIDSDTGLNQMTFSGLSSVPDIVPSENITFETDGLSVTLTITPALDQMSNNPFNITLLINDGFNQITSNIMFKVVGYYIAGAVEYYTGVNNPVSNVIVELSGNNHYTVLTNESGHYSFIDIIPGSYTLTALKETDLLGIESDDATRIRRYKVGDNVNFNCYQEIAADVSLDGTISSLDASRIAIGSAKIYADLQACFQDESCINWVFVENIADCSSWPPISYSKAVLNINVNSNIDNMNLIGIRLGDVTGNWSHTQ